MATRSCRLDIIACILKVACKPCIQSVIVERCNLATVQWYKYRSMLFNTNLLTTQIALNSTYHSPRILYKTTEKGKRFLQLYEALISLIKTEGEKYA
ncbi:MAG: winged helix-turn-helix domain-containing protein [Candidatus Bathyarchaeia archaeon]